MIPNPPAISVAVSPQVTAIGIGQTAQFTATVTGDTTGVTWTASAGTIDALGNFTAPAGPQSSTATVTATSKADTTKSAAASVNVVAPGQFAATANVQVAQYTVTPAAAADVSLQFGIDTNYGLTTWIQSAPDGGGAVSLFVAGMRANTLYHMQGIVKFKDGSQFTESDHTFTTGKLAQADLLHLTATTTPGATPQGGLELFAATTPPGAYVTDLQGNLLWAYDPGLAGELPNPIKMMPNGNFLVNYSRGVPDGADSVLQEVDLAGHVVWQMTAAQLNQALATATCAGCNITVLGTHHDFAMLSNGHLIVIASQEKVETGLIGFPSPVTVLGDVVIDLDENHKPVWLWSAFDHLDLNRHPMAFPDWNHSNSLEYSPDDKALILSMRHQDWILKINYNDGQGDGSILWKLGYQGDFALQGGTDPIDWQYAQHDANVVSDTSSGNLQLLMFDNGNQRVLDPSGTICGTTPCYSRVPIMDLNETAKTATLSWVDNLSPVFSTFGGSARQLKNGNVEFDECSITLVGSNAAVYEVTKTMPAQVVWQMQIAGQTEYRVIRIPSLYPGVQW